MALRASRSDPTARSRPTSRPTARKKTVISPLSTQSLTVANWSAGSTPRWAGVAQNRPYEDPRLAQTRATTTMTVSSTPPTASVRASDATIPVQVSARHGAAIRRGGDGGGGGVEEGTVGYGADQASRLTAVPEPSRSPMKAL